jgi:hypothetical protein
MYDAALERIFPSLLGLPVLVSRLRANPRDALGLLAVGLLMIYGYGWFAQKWIYGRVISQFVLVLQVALAAWIDSRGQPLASGLPRLIKFLTGAALACLVVIALVDARPYLAGSLPGRRSTASQYAFLADHVAQYEVVLADIHTSLVVPALGGKVVASSPAVEFVQDYDRRREAVRLFFSEESTTAQRLEILERYRVDWVLLNAAETPTSRSRLAWLKRVGEVVYTDAGRKLTLFRLRPEAARAGA